MPGSRPLLDLATVTNPVAPDARALLEELLLVADREAATAALAAAIGVDPDRLVLTDGAADALAAVAGSDRRANPRDPDGGLAPADATATVWDETWWSLATGTWTRGDDEAWRTGSLAALWALDGVGSSWVVAPTPADAAELAEHSTGPGPLALALVEPLLELTDLPRWSAVVASLRDDLVVLLGAYGSTVEPSVAPFVLVEDAGTLAADLKAHGVHVRAAAGPAGSPSSVRIAVPDGSGLLTLATALHAVHEGRPPLPSAR